MLNGSPLSSEEILRSIRGSKAPWIENLFLVRDEEDRLLKVRPEESELWEYPKARFPRVDFVFDLWADDAAAELAELVGSNSPVTAVKFEATEQVIKLTFLRDEPLQAESVRFWSEEYSEYRWF